MTSQVEVDRLAREVAQLREAVFAKRYGVSSGQVLLVLGDESEADAISRRLERVPEDLRHRIRVRPVSLPWLRNRSIPGGTA